MPSENFSDAIFETAAIGSLLESECSPQIDFMAEGIALRAPEEVYFRQGTAPKGRPFAPVVVCGAYRFRYDTLGLNGNFVDEIVLVVVDASTNEIHSGKIPRRATMARKPAPEKFDLTAQELAERLIGGNFNPNLAEAFPLPAREAEYIVYATLGPHTSNRVRIKVRERPEP